MREVRRYSDKTVTVAAKRVRRALQHITHKGLSTRDRLDVLVCQLIRQGLEPIDVVREGGADALVIIASALPPATDDPAFDRAMATRKPGWIIVDSYVSEVEIAPGKKMLLPTPTRIRTTKEPSTTWQRVIDRVLQMPEKQTP